MRDPRKRERGMALIFAMIAIIVVLGALGLVMTQVRSSQREADHAYVNVLLEQAAKGGIDMAVARLWDNYIQSSGNTTRNWASYRYFLNNELDIPINEDLNFNGEQDPDEVGNGDGEFDVYPEGYDQRGWALLDTPVELREPDSNRVLATLEGVYIGRYDEWSQSNLTITAVASRDGKSKTAVQMLTIGGADMPHTKFAILANNISCILCHAEFKSMPMEEHKGDRSMDGTFDRVKIAALESMLVRKNGAHSNVAGTVYTRGRVYKENGSEFSPSDLENSSFKGYRFSDENGKIFQDSNGNMQQTSLSNADTNEDGELEQFASLYMDYPSELDEQTDGPLPNSFPAPFPDDNENRHVDDNEFEVIVNSANGRLQFLYADEDDPPGSVTAGVAYGVPEGDLYAGDGLPATSNEALTSLSTTGSYEGNLILVGSEDDPIQINKTVAVDGDLLIKGPVKGEGQLLVRGNTYIMGDVTYADAPGEFGVAEDGTENAFALVSGGSVMMGDYLTVRGVNHSEKTNDKYPDWRHYSIHARDEHRSNNVTIDGKTETLEWGYFDQYSVDAGEEVPGRPGQQFSFTTSELKLFNNLELEKAIADPNYTPRFYGLRASQPNNIYMYDAGDEHAVKYNENGVKLLSEYLIEEGLPLEIMDRAAYHYCSPDANWISEDTLRKIWHADEMSRPSTGRDFKFDGLLYSNNSIFAIVRSNTRHNSNTKGKMTIRGGVIAADLGVFVPGPGSGRGLNLFYDPRVERFLQVTDTSVVTLSRDAFYFLREPPTEQEA